VKLTAPSNGVLLCLRLCH